MSDAPTRHWDDTLHPPADLTPIGSVHYRERAAVRGTVAATRDTRWTGGPVLEVDIEDPTGSLLVAFFGRHHIAGVEAGHQVTVEGVPVRRYGRPVLMNPLLWVEP
jgi:RPA family protein